MWPVTSVSSKLFITALLLLIITTPTLISRSILGQNTQTSPSGATLTVNTDKTTYKTGEQVTATIKLDSTQIPIAGVDIVITFDSTILEAKSLTKGTFLPLTLRPSELANGKATISVGSELPNAKTGTGDIATLTLTSKKAGTATIQFGPDTVIGTPGSTENQLMSQKSAIITITTTPTSTPSPTKTNTPTVTPTTTPNQFQKITFNDIPNPDSSTNLKSSYPKDVINWDSSWYVSGPWKKLTTNNLSFTQTANTGSFTFINPKKLISVRAYNGSKSTAKITISCPETTKKTYSISAGIVGTLTTGWSSACSKVTMTSSNGWFTNFDDIVYQ